jgi:hypothetical protein
MSNGDLPRIRVRRSKFPLRKQRWRSSIVVLNAARQEETLFVSSEGYANRQVCIDIARKVLSGAYADAVVDLR